MNKLNPTVIGIDLGSFTTKVAAVQNGTVDILTNEANFRETPSIVGYGQNQRKIGEVGSVKLKSNSKNTVISPLRFMNRKLISEEFDYVPCKYNYQNNLLEFNISYQQSPKSLQSEQVLASLLTQIKTVISNHQLDPKQIVIGVPSYFSHIERVAVLNAAQIAHISNAKLVNESIAMGLDYGMFNKKALANQNKKNVLFIDFGHSKLVSSLVKFTQNQMEIVNEKYHRNLGCRNIDMKIFGYLSSKFQTKTGLNIKDNKKAELKLLQAIQKQRKILSGINETEISIEYLMEDEDFSEPISREIMATVASSIFEEFQAILMEQNAFISEKKIQIDSIELVGGGTRIPIIIDIIKKVFNMQPSRTINSSQTIARGVTLQAVKKSGLFKFIQYQTVNRAMKQIAIESNGQKLDLGENEVLPFEKTIPFPQPSQVKIFEEGEEIFRGQIKANDELKISVSEEGVVSLNQTEFKRLGSLTKEQMRAFMEEQRKMRIMDEEIIKNYQKKNQLQSLIYQFRELINSSQAKYALEPQILSQVQIKLNQLCDDMENLSFTSTKYEETINNVSMDMNQLQKKINQKLRQIKIQQLDIEKVKKFTENNLNHIASNYNNSMRVIEVYNQIKQILTDLEIIISQSNERKGWELPLVSPQELQSMGQRVKELTARLQVKSRPILRNFN